MRWLPLVALLLITACSEHPEPRSAPALVRGDGFAYELPAGWERAAQSLTPNLRNPVEILAAGTVRDMRAVAGECAHMPVGAIERMTSRDVFVSVMERYGELPAPPRPEHFSLPAEQQQHDATECARGEPPLDVYWFDFTQRRREFYVLVALGHDAGPERRAEALALLDSLRFEPGPQGVDLDSEPTIPMHDAGASLSWLMPHTWRRYDWPLTSVLAPVERLALGTFELGRGAPDATCTPRTALLALPADGAFIYVVEYTDGRGADFPESTGGRELGPERNYECFGPSRMARWRGGDRAFQAHVVFGPRAGARLRDEARSILNSIRPG